MHFDDGDNPWKEPGSSIHVFRFQDSSTAALVTTLSGMLFFTLLSLHLIHFGWVCEVWQKSNKYQCHNLKVLLGSKLNGHCHRCYYGHPDIMYISLKKIKEWSNFCHPFPLSCFGVQTVNLKKLFCILKRPFTCKKKSTPLKKNKKN